MSLALALRLKSAVGGLVSELLVARAEAAAITPEIHALYESFLAAGDYRSMFTGERVLKAEHAYELDEESAAKFNEFCVEAVKPYGLPPGHCPACVADVKVTKAENALLKAVSVLPEFAGFDRVYGEKRKAALRILVEFASAAEKI